jgi:hypothetical protein
MTPTTARMCVCVCVCVDMERYKHKGEGCIIQLSGPLCVKMYKIDGYMFEPWLFALFSPFHNLCLKHMKIRSVS